MFMFPNGSGLTWSVVVSWCRPPATSIAGLICGFIFRTEGGISPRAQASISFVKLQSGAILDSSKHTLWLLPWYSVYHHHHEFGDWHVDMLLSMKDQLEWIIGYCSSRCKVTEGNGAMFFFTNKRHNEPLHFTITIIIACRIAATLWDHHVVIDDRIYMTMVLSRRSSNRSRC